MKNLLYAIMILSCFTSIYPYAFVFGSKSEIADPGVNITVYWPGGTDIAARHKHIKPGNHGRGAEWYSGAIDEQLRKKGKLGSKMPFLIYKGMYGELSPQGHLYRGEISSDERFGFVVKKQGDKYIVVPDQAAANEYVPVSTAPASSVPATRIKCYILRATYGSGSKQADVTAILTNLTNTKLTKNESFNFSGGNGSFNKLFGDPSVGEVKQLFIEFKDEKGMVKTKTIQEDQPFTLP